MRSQVVSVVSAIIVAPLLTGLSGCSPAPDARVGAVVEQFYGAVRDGRGEAACALLAPRTVEEMAVGGDDCAEAVVKLPPPGATRVVRVWGNEAQVRLAADTVFLHRFHQGWRVRAAGCRPRGDEPYLCVVGG